VDGAAGVVAAVHNNAPVNPVDNLITVEEAAAVAAASSPDPWTTVTVGAIPTAKAIRKAA
jgi:hypothetical protein